MHFYFSNQIHRRSSDGIHWNPDAVRYQVNTILTHFCLSREITVPSERDGNEGYEEENGTLQLAKKYVQEAKEEIEALNRNEEREEEREIVTVSD